MNRMNRLISTLPCAVAILIWTSLPAQAEFRGALRNDIPVMVKVTAFPSNAGNTAVTVYYVGRALDVEGVFSVSPGTVFGQEFAKTGARVTRIIVEVDLPVGGS